MPVRRSMLCLFAILSITSPAAARRAPVDDGAGVSADMMVEQEAAGTRVAGARPMIRIPPRPPLTRGELEAALEAARPEIRQCLEAVPAVGTRSAVIRVRLDARHGSSVRANVRPRDPQVQQCVDVAVRRHVVPLQSRPIVRAVSATLRETIGGIGIPPFPPQPPVPPPPPPPNGRYDETEVHGALDAMRASFVECVSDLPRGMPGEIMMSVTVHPDGSITLTGVQLPTGVRGPGSLGCLSGRVRLLRVSPPPGERQVSHALRL